MRLVHVFFLFAAVVCFSSFAAPGPSAGGGSAPASVPLPVTADAPPSWNHFLGLGDFLMTFARDFAGQAYDQQDFSSAAAYFEVLYRVDPSDREVAKRLGFALKESGRYEQAHDLLFQCTVDDPNDYMTWWWLSDAQRLLGDYKKAYESMVAARDAAPENERQGLQSYVDYTEALGTIVPSWPNFEKHREFAKRHEKMRRFRRTIAEYLTALDTIPPSGPEASDTPVRKAWVFNQIGIQYNQLKQPDMALDYFHRAVRTYGEAKSPADVMMATQNLAVTYRALAKTNPVRRVEYLELGAKYWAETLRIAREVNDVPYVRYAQAGEVLCLLGARGVEDAALKAAREENLKELPWNGPVNEYTTGGVAVAELACRMAEGDYAGARVVAEMALPFYVGSGFLLDVEEAVSIYLQLANALMHQGHEEEALKQADLAETRLAELRSYMDADSFARSINMYALRDIAAARVRAGILKGDFDAARGAADAFHIQARADLLGSTIHEDSARNDFVTERELLSRGLAMLEQDLASAAAAGDAVETERLKARIEDDKQRAAWLDKGVRFDAVEAVSYRRVPVLGLLELGPRWPADTQVVSIITDSFGTVIVTFDGEKSWGIDLPEARMDVIQPLAETVSREMAAGTASIAPAMEELSNRLFAPIAGQLTAKTIYIAATGALASVPFELMSVGGEALLARHDVAYIPSASHIIHMQARPQAEGAAVRIAGEASAEVGSALPGAVSCATELCASQAVEAAAAMLVLGELDLSAPDPMLAAITLAPEGLYDGTLYAAELLGAHVNTNTVWIAPNSMRAVGRYDAWPALEEGFMQAGARAVVRPIGAANTADLVTLLKPTLGADGFSVASFSAAKRNALAATPENVGLPSIRVSGIAE